MRMVLQLQTSSDYKLITSTQLQTLLVEMRTMKYLFSVTKPRNLMYF